MYVTQELSCRCRWKIYMYISLYSSKVCGLGFIWTVDAIHDRKGTETILENNGKKWTPSVHHMFFRLLESAFLSIFSLFGRWKISFDWWFIQLKDIFVVCSTINTYFCLILNAKLAIHNVSVQNRFSAGRVPCVLCYRSSVCRVFFSSFSPYGYSNPVFPK